ncbi:hypothetical protein KSW79_00145 [Prevotella copri]|jgi:hypothetical protein|uniref:Uncharacterized protein n=1 Tax=Segatella copri TaxID=165179 RepID=A0A6A7WEE5_9BACT|nr:MULTISPECIES: hypothetical protein [Prevotellaceae]MBD9073252.1 hypothetical protein [Prevotella sp.]CDC24266.1 putative uncharacterized protein [Prevotella sp. CAG:386]MBD9261723.1 hypothetical protein [Prevotella sp.]MBV3412825.1 hypothetical protein [Segatella copri]MDD6530167.1 hypothetical protein [Segatella copri]
MYKIQANQSGTRSIEVSDLHLETIDKYQLLRNLVDSNGIIDEGVLEKLKLNVRALLEADNCQDKALLDLCLDVIYNSNMKALGLHNLVLLYVDWLDKRAANEAEDTNAITD